MAVSHNSVFGKTNFELEEEEGEEELAGNCTVLN